MQLVGVARLGPRLPAHFIDGARIEAAELAPEPGIDPPQRHRPRAPLLERRVVEKGIGIGVENLMGHGRRRRRIDGDRRDGAALDLREQPRQAVHVHRLVQTIVHRLFDQRVIGKLDGSGAVVLAHHLLGKNRGEQIFGAHALERHGNLAPAAVAQDRQRPARVPAPAVVEHRRSQRGLGQVVFENRGLEHGEHIAQRKGVLFDQRDANAVVGGRRLQLAVEAHAKALAQRQPPGAIDAPAPGRMKNELHAAGLVEEALGDDFFLRRHGAERGDGFGDVIDDLLGGARRHGNFRDQPARRRAAIG